MKKKHNDSQKVFGKMDRWDIPLENDLMFSTVMQCRDACIGLLETIFDGRKVKSLEYKDSPSSVTQKYVVFNPANKSIRLDVYFEDGDGVYDMEIQKVDKGNLPRRTRMYSSMMDANMLDKGLEYDALKKSYVIFVCMFDVFGQGMKSYRFRTMCENVQGLPLETATVSCFQDLAYGKKLKTFWKGIEKKQQWIAVYAVGECRASLPKNAKNLGSNHFRRNALGFDAVNYVLEPVCIACIESGVRTKTIQCTCRSSQHVRGDRTSPYDRNLYT